MPKRSAPATAAETAPADPVGDSIRAVLVHADTRPGTYTLAEAEGAFVRTRDDDAPDAGGATPEEA